MQMERHLRLALLSDLLEFVPGSHTNQRRNRLSLNVQSAAHGCCGGSTRSGTVCLGGSAVGLRGAGIGLRGGAVSLRGAAHRATTVVVVMMMVPSPAHVLEVLLESGESLLRSGQVSRTQGGLEGLKIFGALADPAVLTSVAGGSGSRRRAVVRRSLVERVMAGPDCALQVLLQGGESLLRSGHVPGVKGALEGFKVLGTLADLGIRFGSAAGLRTLRRAIR